MESKFNFYVRLSKGWTSTQDSKRHPPEYKVELPHQCEGWLITGTPDKAAAISEMEQFIWEAKEALTRLKALQPEKTTEND